MNITRENFDEICMLYADNELSAEERSQVEAFVAANPDLRADLELFLSLKLDADSSVSFGDRSPLHRGMDEIAAASEEELLLLLDGELDEKAKQSLESRLAANERLQSEWAILQNTKLDVSEQVVYPDKQGLYRHTSARVIRFTWVRYAAAAAIILAAGLFWLNRKDSGNEAVRGSIAIRTSPATNNADADSPGNSIAGANADNMPGSEPQMTTTDQDAQVALASAPVATKASEGPAKVSSAQPAGQGIRKTAAQQPASGSAPLVARLEPVQANTNPGQESIAVSTPTDLVPGNRPVADVTDRAIGEQAFKSDYATQALANNADEAEATEAVMSENNRSRKGLRGFVRKANRIFNKVTNPDLDKPLVKATNIQIGVGR